MSVEYTKRFVKNFTVKQLHDLFGSNYIFHKGLEKLSFAKEEVLINYLGLEHAG